MYKTLVLKSGRDRSVNNRHPWIFSGAVKQAPMAENGDIVAVEDNSNHLLGYGFYSPNSQITCRMFEFTDQLIDFSKSAYWHNKISSAFALRKSQVINADTNAFRLLHAEGDFLPGIVADVYTDIAVLQLLVKGTEKIIPHIISGLTNTGINHVYLKNKHSPGFREEVSLPNGFLTQDNTDLYIVIHENGLKFKIDIERGQKTGFFIDQRDNRALLKQYTAGKRVLNTFSYTGGFSVYALAGQAAMVHSVDISKDATFICDENIHLNFGSTDSHKAVTADCFDYLRNTQELYELIVLDPPAFAKNARAVPNASRGYKDLNLIAFKKIQPGGIIFTFSCSQNIDKELFRKIIFAAAADARRNIRILHQLSQPVDHPVNIFHPEGEYLKGLVLYVE